MKYFNLSIVLFRYSIDDLLTPHSSLTNVTGLPNIDTTRSLLASHDGLMNNTMNPLSSSSTVNNKISTIDPLPGLLLGNTTAFDAVHHHQQQQETHTHSFSSKQKQTTTNVTTSPQSRITDSFKSKGISDKDSSPSSLIINGKFLTFNPISHMIEHRNRRFHFIVF